MTRSLVSEALGTALLLAIVVGSGIMGQSLAGGNTAIALLANSIATGLGLVVLILVFGPISGAHLNPVVTLVAAVQGKLSWARVGPYLIAQFIGAVAGVVLAHIMFNEPIVTLLEPRKIWMGQLVSEVVATFGLVITILAVERTRPTSIPHAVGLYITAAYWFTASTSFANPAVTVARALTNTFAGIQPSNVPGFLIEQLAGGAIAASVFNMLWETSRGQHSARQPLLIPGHGRRRVHHGYDMLRTEVSTGKSAGE